MVALWMHARSQWRARRGALLVLAVLVAIGTAATFTAFAGARRTGSVVERFVAAPPAEVENLEQVERLPQFLALFLVMLGVVAVGHALVVTVRRRRRDFGVLRAVGFRARDVRVAVSWQAIVIAVFGCLIGLPVGVLLARSVWGAVAQSIGVRTVLELPAAALLGVLLLTVLMAMLVSLVPARRAAKLAPTQLLRSE